MSIVEEQPFATIEANNKIEAATAFLVSDEAGDR
jgi:hypothetical protein